MGDKVVNIRVRFPEEVRDRVKSFAEADRRSLNSEILALLEEAMEARRDRKPPRLLRCAESDPGYDPDPPAGPS